MARVFNLVLFDGTITGDTIANNPPVFYTSQEHASLLGSVERLQMQMIIRASTSLPSTVDVVYQMTNVPEYDAWVDSSAKSVSTGGSASTLPAVGFDNISSIANQAAYGRFKIFCSTSSTVQFQLVVSGYAD